ncbi:hypothetical protein JT689_01655 (plasmid) [Halobacterium sp. GSL-19]|uniref:hypothetical protein n=1 Tax=Halobacterium sp. GSL-19 TaxID=2812551 RepID=UPI00196554EE|nr:hypothetical protein [Halobacterium sp. GSL-19]QRY21739.1 hypothetical protein JT689_01655 [Halobacterium sp. GSL-19]
MDIVRITIDSELGTGIFEMYSTNIQPSLRTGYVVGGRGRGSTVNAVLGQITNDGEDSKRKGVYLDAGGGSLIWSIGFRQWSESTGPDGDPLQWGDDPDPSVHTKTSASGDARALSKLECLVYWLAQSTIDSENPATLEYGQHYPDGVYSAKDVVFEEPQIRNVADDGTWISGDLTLVSAANLSQIQDAASRLIT